MKAHDIEPVASSPIGRTGSKMGPKGSSNLLEEQTLRDIASELGNVATPAQIAIAWGLARGYSVIPKATSPEH